MRRFRTQWLALFGALVILSLSLSSAFGARPTDAGGEALTFGQQVSEFVHSLQSADPDGDEDQDEDPADECDTDEDSPTDETPDEGSEETPADETGATDEDGAQDSDISTDDADAADESEDEVGDRDGTNACDTEVDAGEDADEDSEDPEETDDSGESAASNHGRCVAEVAHDPEAVGENGTHGWAVSEAARVTCWQEFADPDNADTDDVSEDTDEDTDGDADESDASRDEVSPDKPHGKSAQAHQRKQDRGSGKPSWAGMNAGGHGHGKGGPHH